MISTACGYVRALNTHPLQAAATEETGRHDVGPRLGTSASTERPCRGAAAEGISGGPYPGQAARMRSAARQASAITGALR